MGDRLIALENSDAYGRMIRVCAPVLKNGLEIKQCLRKAEEMLKECKDFLD